MVREGTRSQTGNARPRVFNTVDTGPTIKRTKPTTGAGRKPKSTATTTTSAGAKSVGKGAGVVKSQKPAKSAGSAAGKVGYLLLLPPSCPTYWWIL